MPRTKEFPVHVPIQSTDLNLLLAINAMSPRCADSISLREVRSERMVCRLLRDNFSFGDWCIMTNGKIVWIMEQKVGFPIKQSVMMPKTIFNRLLRGYERPQRRVKT